MSTCQSYFRHFSSISKNRHDMLDGFITHVENKVNTTAVYGQIRKHTEADNHIRLVLLLFDDPSSSIY